MYLSKSKRPEISFAVYKASRKIEQPTISDSNKLINILKYINSTKNYKNKYYGKDFASDKTNKKIYFRLNYFNRKKSCMLNI